MSRRHRLTHSDLDLRFTASLRYKDGEVLRHVTYFDIGKAERARSWIRWLHTGEAGGWAGQALRVQRRLQVAYWSTSDGCADGRDSEIGSKESV